MPFRMQMEEATSSASTLFRVSGPNLRFASTVDKGTDWIVSSCATDIQLSAVPRLDQTDEVCTLLLETQRLE